MPKGYRSSIPKGATERKISQFRSTCESIFYAEFECIFKGEIVGNRLYEEGGTLIREIPLRHGRQHGVVFNWYEGGTALSSAEPFHNGVPHGLASQWDFKGRLIGTYHLVNGTGYDFWRVSYAPDKVHLSEVLPMKDGTPHGLEQWLNEDQKSVHYEKHWFEGQEHGIERNWNRKRKLCRGFPRYFVNGNRVTKRQYISASKKDPTLPKFDEADNDPKRTFVPEVLKAMKEFSS